MPDSRYIAKVRRRKTFWNNVTRVVIQLFVWTGAVSYTHLTLPTT